MKKTNYVLFVLLLLAGLINNCGTASGYNATLAEGRSAANEMLTQTGASSVSIAFVADGQIVWAESFGYADKEAQRAPTAETMYGIGSVSKMLATVATMKLVDQGLISLDTPVVTYVPLFSMLVPEYTQITVRMLLNHSSGFPGTDYRNSSTSGAYLTYATEQLMTSLSEERLKHAPGYLNTYCNDGFSMLENIIASVSGKSFVDYVQDEVLTPLEMNNSRYPTEAFPAGSYAETYTGDQKNQFLFGNVYASGGFYSTPSDMARLALMILGRGAIGATRILSEASIDAMSVDQTIGKFDPVPSENDRPGLGWDTISEGGLEAVGVSGWSKGGDIGAFGAELLVAPNDNLAVVVIGASGIGSSNALVIAERIMLRALYEKGAISAFPTPLSATIKPARTPTADELAAITGYFATSGSVYRMDANADNSLSLFKYDGTTWGSPSSSLIMRDDGMFSTDASPLKEFFTATGDGRTYIAIRNTAGYGHYQDNALSLEKIAATTPLSSAWNGRLSKTWLLVNERADAIFSASVTEPRFSFSTPDGLTGLVVANTHDGTLNVVDPSQSDTLAEMMLIMPQAGRDINDVFIISRNSEEWIRYGSYFYRPKETVPQLASPGGTITIGSEGYAEWRAIDSSGAGKNVTVTTTTGNTWRLFDPNITWLATEEGTGTVSLPATTGNYYLIFYGNAGDSIQVTIENS